MHANHASDAFVALDRRSFVAAGAALTAGAAALAGTAHAEEAADAGEGAQASDNNGTSTRPVQAQADETVECDVVIAGAGIAGLMAADHLQRRRIRRPDGGRKGGGRTGRGGRHRQPLRERGRRGGEALVRAGHALVVMDSAYYNACQNKGIYAYLGEPAEWVAGEEAGYYNPTPENAEAHLEQAIEEGWGIKADTIDEIAEKFGLTNLAATVEAYNAMCEAGEDTEFYKPACFMKAVSEPPFYAFEYVPSAWGTNGGVKVDSGLHALNADNDAIEGLYVAGVDAGSMYTMPYYTNPGSSVGNAMGSGWAMTDQIAADLAQAPQDGRPAAPCGKRAGPTSVTL